MLGLKAVVALLVLGSGFLSACGSNDTGLYTWTNGVPSTPSPDAAISSPILAGPFVVSEYFAPYEFGGDAAVGHVKTGLPCKERPAGARGTCYRFDYEPGEVGSADVIFMPNKDGPFALSFSLENLHAISFQAAAMVGGQAATFTGGGVTGNPVAPPDQFKVEASGTLGTAWLKIQMPLPVGVEPPVTRLAGAFAWSIHAPMYTGGVLRSTITLFLDDIVYE